MRRLSFPVLTNHLPRITKRRCSLTRQNPYYSISSVDLIKLRAFLIRTILSKGCAIPRAESRSKIGLCWEPPVISASIKAVAGTTPQPRATTGNITHSTQRVLQQGISDVVLPVKSPQDRMGLGRVRWQARQDTRRRVGSGQ